MRTLLRFLAWFFIPGPPELERGEIRRRMRAIRQIKLVRTEEERQGKASE